MNHSGHNYTAMFIIMIISGLLSTMNVWANSINDIRFSINDIYMTLLMTGWMFLFMGAINREYNVLYFGLALVIVNFICIRTQFLVTQNQYLLGMIPHHSMAIHMSKKLIEKDNKITTFLQSIIRTQANEIEFMKTGI